MEYLEIIQTIQNVGGFVFALCFWLGCYRLEKAVNGLKN